MPGVICLPDERPGILMDVNAGGIIPAYAKMSLTRFVASIFFRSTIFA